MLRTLCASGVAVAATVTLAVPTPPAARASSRICVGVVVDATALGGGTRTGCARVGAGSTGSTDLAAAGFTVGYRRDGLVCTINGLPRAGCSATDSSHYWSYWHRSPRSSSWRYATEGPSSYTPPNGSSEGWVWQDGGQRPPPSIPYSTLCPAAAQQPAPPRSAPRPSTAPRRATTPPAGGHSTTATRATATAHQARRVSAAVQAARASRSAVPSASASPSADASGSTPPGSPAVTQAQPVDRASRFPTGLVAGAALLVALVTAIAVRARRAGRT